MASERASSGMGERLIIFTRFPEPGKVKSRLARDVGDRRALEVHDVLARHAVSQARKWGGEFEIRITGGSEDEWHAWLGDARWIDQGRGDLGARLDRAVNDTFRSGSDRVVVMGSDCPGLDHRRIKEAFDRLADSEVVIGPALDGGYYLLGLSRPSPSLFREVDWGSERVLEQTLAKAPDAALLDPLGDVDTATDLGHLDGLPDFGNDG